MPVLSRSGGGSRFYSLEYICLESSKNFIGITEAVGRRCSVEKVFLEISKNTFSYRTPSVATSGITHNLMIISIFFCTKFRKEFCKIFKKTFSYRTPPVAASGYKLLKNSPFFLNRTNYRRIPCLIEDLNSLQ